jgi:hypothetical protein
MLRCTLLAGLLAVLASGPSADLRAEDKKANDKKAWQEAELKKLAGRWTSVREEKTGPDTTRTRRVDLEFAGGELSVSTFDDKGKREWDGSLKVVGVGPNLLTFERAEAHYDLIDGRLVVVGRIGYRPWEGFALSGEYRRAAKAK